MIFRIHIDLMYLAAAEDDQETQNRAGIQEGEDGAENGDFDIVHHGIQQDIDEDDSDNGDQTGRDDVENLAEYGTDGEKDDQVLPFAAEIGKELGFYVEPIPVLGVGHDAIGLMELVEADGVDGQHEEVCNQRSNQ